METVNAHACIKLWKGSIAFWDEPWKSH